MHLFHLQENLVIFFLSACCRLGYFQIPCQLDFPPDIALKVSTAAASEIFSSSGIFSTLCPYLKYASQLALRTSGPCKFVKSFLFVVLTLPGRKVHFSYTHKPKSVSMSVSVWRETKIQKRVESIWQFEHLAHFARTRLGGTLAIC